MSGRLLLDPARAPIEVVDLDLPGGGAEPELRRVGGTDPASFVPLPAGSVLALVREAGRPVGLIQTVIGDRDRTRDHQTAAVAAAAHAQLGGVLGRPAADPAPPPAHPVVTVVVATRERPALLARCLDSLEALRYQPFEVVVVDNAPETGATRRLVEQRGTDRLRYVREPLRGLAAAHNRGLLEALGEIVAFTDDDVVVDPGWLDALVSGFADPAVGCVTGLILPARLHNATQVLLEAHGGFSKGFDSRGYRVDRPPADQPLFPFTAGRLGSGANMAFRTSVLRGIGGFDSATGTGTPARGGDDLLSFFRVVVHGHTLLYQPEALVWHHHRDRPEDMEGQAFAYGAGLGAYLTAAVVNEPRMLPALLRRLPRGIRYARTSTAATGAGAGAGTGAGTAGSWPTRLSRLQRRGMLYGPLGYLLSRRRVRSARPSPGPGPAPLDPRAEQLDVVLRRLVAAVDEGHPLQAFLHAAGASQIIADRLQGGYAGPRLLVAAATAARGRTGLAAWHVLLRDLTVVLAEAVIAGTDQADVTLLSLRGVVDGLRHGLRGRAARQFSSTVLRSPSAFVNLGLRPDDAVALADLFAARSPDRDRPILVLGLRPSGAYLGPLLAAALGQLGYRHVVTRTTRTMGPLLPEEPGLPEAVRRVGGLAVLIAAPPRSGAGLSSVVGQLRNIGFGPDRIIPVYPALDEGEQPPALLDGHPVVALPASQWIRLRASRD